MTAVLHVCRSCEGREAVRRRHGGTSGMALRAAIEEMILALPDHSTFDVISQDCMGPCGLGVCVALTAPGRWGWLFQDLQPGEDVAALAEFLTAWRVAPHGVPAKTDRPTRLVRKTIGRLPPSGTAGGVVTNGEGDPDDNSDG